MKSKINKILQIIPIILFFLFLFYTILFLFGTNAIIITSMLTSLFKSNYKKKQNFKSILSIWCIEFLLLIFAYLATINIKLTIFLNFIVPFLLIFIRSSQINPTGYYIELMTFTFLQIRPVDFQGFLTQIYAMFYGLCIFTILILIYQKTNEYIPDYDLEKKGILNIKKILTKLIDKENIEPLKTVTNSL